MPINDIFLIYTSYINYGNIARASTSQAKLKKNTKQQHVVRIIFDKEKEAHATPLLREIHALNVYQINILQILTFIQKNITVSREFLNTFEEIEHKYTTRFSKYNFKQTPAFTNYAKFSISCQGPQSWNRILSETEKKKHFKPSYF